MKHDSRFEISEFRFLSLVLCFWLVEIAASAVTVNPYEAIVGRNVFGLKPPPPTTNAAPPVVPAAITIKLQGISTILDRRQVLLKVKTAARPPEPAKEKSYLWSEGQGEGDIEVLEIDAVAGVVRIKNQDLTQSLTMKDDAERPAVGAALPSPATPNPQASGLPGIPAPPPGAAPAPNPGGVSPTGGTGRTIPTRSLRTSTTDGVGLGTGLGKGSTTGVAADTQAQLSEAGQRSMEENVALYEINRAKNEALIQSGVRLPRMPPHVLIRPAGQ